EYADLKCGLADQFRFDREAYTDAKGRFVERIVELARRTASMTRSIETRPAAPDGQYSLLSAAMTNTDLIVIGAYRDEMEAEVARSALEAADIDSMIQGDSVRGPSP